MKISTEAQPEPTQPLQANRSSARTLNGLLGSLVEEDGSRLLFGDSPARAAWCGRLPRSYSRACAQDAVGRIGRCLRQADLPAGASVAIWLSGGPESSLALLGTLWAGLTPCLLPLDLDEAALLETLEATDARAVLTQAQAADLRPASMFCVLAARLFRLRYVMSFGPDVPDGVIDLDRVNSEDPGAARTWSGWTLRVPAPHETGIVTLNRADGRQPVFRSISALLAAGEALAPFAPQTGDRIVSYLVPDDLKALCTGLVPCLLSGATLEHALLGRELAQAGEGGQTHAVLPRWSEPIVTALDHGMSAQTRIYVSDAPVAPLRLPDARPAENIVDVVSFGERIVLAGKRGEHGSPPLADRLEARRDRIEWRWTERGSLSVRGPAAAVLAFDRTTPPAYADLHDSNAAWIDGGPLFTIPTAQP